MTPTVVMETSLGTIEIELNKEKAPITVANFEKYVKEGFFDGLCFHRVIKGFMIQGGGFTPDGTSKDSGDPIKIESMNGLKNKKGTIAMARTSNPNSATSQFFINLTDNDFLNFAGPANPGYAVFGKVTEGIETIDEIAKVKTGRKGMHDDVPKEPVTIESVRRV